jgi:hypothetical protein
MTLSTIGAERAPDLAISNDNSIDELRSQAYRCRRLAGGIGDRRVSDALFNLASEYDATAAALGEAERLRAS